MFRARLALLVGVFVFPAALIGQNVTDLYEQNCMSCHGDNLEGGQADSLLNDRWAYGGSDAEIADVIREGRPDDGMPGFGEQLSDKEIRALVIFIREREKRARPQPAAEKLDGEVRRSEEHDFRMEVVTESVSAPWAVDFLPDGDLLVTEKAGQLKRFSAEGGDGVLIEGVPSVRARGQGGMLDIAVDPDYDKTGWIYLSFSDPSEDGERSLTAVVRGRLENDRWVDEQTVFRASEEFYLPTGVHFGTRLVFDGDFLFFAIGDRGRKEQAQDLARPNGKVHRVHRDGSIPEDNPFRDREGACPTIWTYGNRNPQGIALATSTGRLWSTEHGPRGGDELNLLEAGKNYGWPEVTHGMNYNGTPMTDQTSAPGMEDPVVHWTPSIAVCGLAVYEEGPFAAWEGDLLAGSLAGKELRRLRLQGSEVIGQEVLLRDLGRVRDVVVGPGGLVYVVFNGPDRIVRLIPENSP